MKKLLVLSFALLAAFHLAAQGIRPSVGAEIGFFPGVLENQTMNDYAGILFTPGTRFSFDNSYSAIVARVYADFGYGLLSVGYRSAVSQATTKLTVGGASGSASTDLSLSHLEFRALGKLPVTMGQVTISFMAGLEYTRCLQGEIGGITFPSQTLDDYSDFSILGGLGMEFRLSRQAYIRPAFTVGYSLTSQRNSSYYTGVSYVSSSGWEYEIALGIGFWL